MWGVFTATGSASRDLSRARMVLVRYPSSSLRHGWLRDCRE